MKTNREIFGLARGSGGGINLLDTKTGYFKHYLRGSNIVDIFQDSDGIIWVGTQSGLYRRNNDTDDFSAFIDPTSELGTANIVGIIEDAQKNLWIGSQSAIIKLDHAPRMKQLFMAENMGLFQTARMILQHIKPAMVNYYLEMAPAILNSFPGIWLLMPCHPNCK